MRRLSIRWKLTLWYGVVLGLVLAGFSAAVYFTLRRHLLQRVDQGLAEELSDVLYEVSRADDEGRLSEWLDRRFARHEGFDFLITRPGGERFFVNARLASTSFPHPDVPGPPLAPSYRTVWVGETQCWRVVSVQAQGPRDRLTVQVARSLEAVQRESRELLVTFLLVGPVTLALTVAAGYFLARRALAPVQRITQTANQITADRLSQRIEVPNPDDELGALGRTLNRMIERLERSFTDMQRFTADAAHELRTPLAVIRNEAEVALRAPRSAEGYCRVLENLLDETNRLSHVAEQLLFLSRQDAGLLPPAWEAVATDQLLREVVGTMQLVAQEKGICLTAADNARCLLTSDSRQLRRVLYNLMDNAIKYTGAAGRVAVSGTVNETGWTLTVADTGSGIPPEHLPHVFERFYRVDPARSADGSGAGLGLAICRSILTSLGGTITIDSDLGKGTTVRVELPVNSLGKSATS
jgi:heavy metal sensor kinase